MAGLVPKNGKLNGRKIKGKDDQTANNGGTIKTPLIKTQKKKEKKPSQKSSNSNPKADKKTNPDIKVAIDHYYVEFLRIHGIKPQINGAHAKTFQGLLAEGGRSLGEVKELTTAYLSQKNERLREAGYPVEWFPGNINGLLLQKKEPKRGLVY